MRAHLAQQDLDLVAEREAAMQIHHVWGKQSSSFQEVDGLGPAAPDTETRGKRREPGAPTGINLRALCALQFKANFKHTDQHSFFFFCNV